MASIKISCNQMYNNTKILTLQHLFVKFIKIFHLIEQFSLKKEKPPVPKGSKGLFHIFSYNVRNRCMHRRPV